MQRTRVVVWLFVLFLLVSGSLDAQRLGGGDTAPRFLLASSTSVAPVAVDAREMPTLRHRLTLHLEHATLEEALREITDQTGLRFSYSRDVVRVDSRVSIRAEEITLAAALTELLIGAGIDVVFSRHGPAALVRQPPPPPRVALATGTITGSVIDAETGAAVAAAEVWIEGTRWRTLTSNQGRFLLAAVTEGDHEVSVRRIGYAVERRAVTVVADGSVNLSFALQAVPTFLDGVVATVTGTHRVRELGHVVSRINADSVVRASPVASMSELLTARVPGLQVFSAQGSVGGDASLRIRGATTFLLASEPIIIVDGVRYFGGRVSADGGGGQFSLGIEPSLRLNDLNPNEIESIEVVKGPSAATLYGTDAANGVIVITTRRGRDGPAQWNAYSRFSISEIPTDRMPDMYRGVSPEVANCTLQMVANGQCTQERIEILPNPMTLADYTLFAAAPSWLHGASVSGGSGGIRYHISADYDDATGPVQMPPAIAQRAKQERGVERLPNDQLRPNQMTKLNLRSNLSARPTGWTDLQATVGFSQSRTRALNLVYGPYQTSSTSSTSTPENPYGTGPNQPDQEFARTTIDDVQRFTGGLRADARPAPWLSTWAAVGLDQTNSDRSNLALPGEGSPQGLVSDIRSRNVLTTLDVGTQSFLNPIEEVTLRTTVGGQYVRSFTGSLLAAGSGLPPGGKTVAAAATQSMNTSHIESVTLGGYVEQMFGYRDRLFLTAALRADGGSSFGRDYRAAVYPKFNGSWIISEGGSVGRVPVDEMRVRYAFGGSGRQPTTAMALPTYSRVNRTVYGVLQSTVFQSGVGNPDLRPERTLEHEYGFDSGFFGDRIRVEGTWYHRTTLDGIRSVALPTGLGSQHVNVGEVRDRGIEALVRLRFLDIPSLIWDVTLLHARNHNRVIRLGDAPPVYSALGGLVEGYPIGARFSRPFLGYEDANGDGIIETSEVLIGEDVVYQGLNTPPLSQTIHTGVALLQQRVRVSATFDRRAGHVESGNRLYSYCSSGYCRELVDPSTPKERQALAVAPRLGFGLVEDAGFVRFRELGLSADIPGAVTTRLNLDNATVAVQARNLFLWTRFGGEDPESASAWRSRGTNGSSGGVFGLPQARSWVFRIDVGL